MLAALLFALSADPCDCGAACNCGDTPCKCIVACVADFKLFGVKEKARIPEPPVPEAPAPETPKPVYSQPVYRPVYYQPVYRPVLQVPSYRGIRGRMVNCST